jgi:hypothetical protein
VARQRAATGAAHLLVDVAVVDAVEGVGTAGGQGPADDGGDHEPQRRHATLGEEHHRDRGEEQELDHPRLGETDVGTHDVADARLPRGSPVHGHLGVEGGHGASPSPPGRQADADR